jgi:two-component system chemotaxis response regulator CheY
VRDSRVGADTPEKTMAAYRVVKVLYFDSGLYRRRAIARANILIVEDSFVVARRLQLSLERSGFCVDIARNGREACTKAQRKAFDLVVTDEKMPVMSGRELCRQLRQDDRYTQTPIIFLTANPNDLDPQELDQALSVSAVFEKPFRPEAIVHLIENELLSARGN